MVHGKSKQKENIRMFNISSFVYKGETRFSYMRKIRPGLGKPPKLLLLLLLALSPMIPADQSQTEKNSFAAGVFYFKKRLFFSVLWSWEYSGFSILEWFKNTINAQLIFVQQQFSWLIRVIRLILLITIKQWKYD